MVGDSTPTCALAGGILHAVGGAVKYLLLFDRWGRLEWARELREGRGHEERPTSQGRQVMGSEPLAISRAEALRRMHDIVEGSSNEELALMLVQFDEIAGYENDYDVQDGPPPCSPHCCTTNQLPGLSHHKACRNCCDNEKRNMDGGCDSCGDPCF